MPTTLTCANIHKTMTTIETVLPYVQIVLSVILVAAILLQQSSGGAGGAFGDSFSTTHHTRRGFEKTLFIISIVVGILFVLSAFVALIIRS